jgi:imidazolonepropionase-like amidohydrolase
MSTDRLTAQCVVPVLLALVVLGCGSTAAATLAVRGETVHTMAGEAITDGVVIVRDGKISAVGSASSTPIPSGAEVLEAAVVTPGLIDAHSVVGLAGYLNQDHDQDQLERSAPIQPELRAIDSYNARERLIEWIRSFGVTTLHTGHGPGALVSGQTMIAKTSGATVDDAVIVPVAMVAATLGEGATNEDRKKAPGTRSKAVAMLRGELIKAGEYEEKMQSEDESKRPARDLRMEALGLVLDRELPLLVTVQRHNDILSALRIGEEFDIRIVLDGAAEAYLVLDQIKKSGAPVVVHPLMQRAFAEQENLSMETPAALAREGIPIALQSGYESYVPKTRVVLFEAAIAVAYGLPYEKAVAAMTIDSAKLLGIDDRVGSLEAGKDADLALFDGDPFEYTTHCTHVIIGGVPFSGEDP